MVLPWPKRAQLDTHEAFGVLVANVTNALRAPALRDETMIGAYLQSVFGWLLSDYCTRI